MGKYFSLFEKGTNLGVTIAPKNSLEQTYEQVNLEEHIKIL